MRPASLAWVIAAAMALPALAQETSKEPQPVPAPPSRIGLDFIRIPPGEYKRGFEGGDYEHQFYLDHLYSTKPSFGREQPAHQVELTKPFDLATTEVTVGQFAQFVQATGYKTDAEKGGGALGFKPDEKDYVDRYAFDPAITWKSPGFDQTADDPVVAVSWRDAKAFCEWLSKAEGVRYRLPSEAEWEYACRAGTDSYYSWGNQPDKAYAHANVADGALATAYPGMVKYQRAVKLGANEGDGFVFTAPVKSRKPNPWGLYDMHGNVWEWCEDRWQDSRYGAQMKGLSREEKRDFKTVDPLFLEETDQHEYGDWRLIRGGAWNCAPANTRSSIRTYQEAGDAAIYTGFRIVREVPDS